MSESKNHIIYTSKDIEAYYSGRLSAAQMHAMEKAAQDDAFLAEAMEGFEGMKGTDWNSQIAALHRHFENMGSTAKVIPMRPSGSRWWKIAAAVLVLGCGATITYMFTKKSDTEKHDQIAQNVQTPTTQPTKPDQFTQSTQPGNTESTQPANTNPANNSVSKPNTTTVAINPANSSTPLAQNNETRAKKVEPSELLNTPAQSSATRKEDQVALADTKTKAEEKDKNNVTPPPPLSNMNVTTNAAAGNNNAFAKAKTDDDYSKMKAQQKQAVANRAEQPSKVFAAQVVGPDNIPLPFSNVTITQENFGTFADVKGNFRLMSSDSVVNVEVRSVGYLPRNYTLRSDAQNRIVLAEDANTAMERAVVVNDGQSSSRILRRAQVFKDSTFVNVEPADGWDNYNTYIANNLDVPTEALKKNLHGEVELSFKVHPNGAITDITVNKTDCADCAELAKRLVEQGPQWKIKKGLRKSNGRIRMQF